MLQQYVCYADGRRVHEDEVDLDGFFEDLRSAEGLPTTSHPTTDSKEVAQVQFKLLRVIGVVAAVAASLAVVSAGSAAPGARVGPVTASASKYGKVLFDGRGRSLYVFARDRGAKSRCYGACAIAAFSRSPSRS